MRILILLIFVLQLSCGDSRKLKNDDLTKVNVLDSIMGEYKLEDVVIRENDNNCKAVRTEANLYNEYGKNYITETYYHGEIIIIEHFRGDLIRLDTISIKDGLKDELRYDYREKRLIGSTRTIEVSHGNFDVYYDGEFNHSYGYEYDERGNESKVFKDGELFAEYTNLYERGNLVSKLQSRSGTNDTISYNKYEYDSLGRITREFLIEGCFDRMHLREYDPQGCWNKMLVYSKDDPDCIM